MNDWSWSARRASAAGPAHCHRQPRLSKSKRQRSCPPQIQPRARWTTVHLTLPLKTVVPHVWPPPLPQRTVTITAVRLPSNSPTREPPPFSLGRQCRVHVHRVALVARLEHLVGTPGGPDRRVGPLLVDQKLRRAPDIHLRGHVTGSINSSQPFPTLLPTVLLGTPPTGAFFGSGVKCFTREMPSRM